MQEQVSRPQCLLMHSWKLTYVRTCTYIHVHTGTCTLQTSSALTLTDPISTEYTCIYTSTKFTHSLTSAALSQLGAITVELMRLVHHQKRGELLTLEFRRRVDHYHTPQLLNLSSTDNVFPHKLGLSTTCQTKDLGVRAKWTLIYRQAELLALFPGPRPAFRRLRGIAWERGY